MDSGMLWFDNSVIPLTLKIEHARSHFLNKHGHHATRCEVSDKETFIPDPADIRRLSGNLKDPGLSSIEARRNILPNHLILGPV